MAVYRCIRDCERLVSVSGTGQANPVALHDTEGFATEYYRCSRCGTYVCDRCATKEPVIREGSPCATCGQPLSQGGFPAVGGAQVVPLTTKTPASKAPPVPDPVPTDEQSSWTGSLTLLATSVEAARDAGRWTQAEDFGALAAAMLSRAGLRVSVQELPDLLEFARRFDSWGLPNQGSDFADALAELAASRGEDELARASAELAVSFRQRSAPSASATRRAARPPTPARSLLECRLLAQARGLPHKHQQRVIVEDGDDLLVTIRPDSFFRGPEVVFRFRVRRADHAATVSPLRLTPDGATSQLLDPGELLAVSEEFAKGSTKIDGKPQGAALRELWAIETAAACLDGIIAAFPPDADQLTADAMRTNLGRETFVKQMSRFSRGRIGAIGRVYRKIADDFRAYAVAQGFLRPEDIPTA